MPPWRPLNASGRPERPPKSSTHSEVGQTVSTEQDWLTPDPWEQERDRKARHRREMHAYFQANPDERAAYWRRYRREYARRRRGRDNVTGWLHELACTGNHHGHVKCQPIPAYSLREVAT